MDSVAAVMAFVDADLIGLRKSLHSMQQSDGGMGRRGHRKDSTDTVVVSMSRCQIAITGRCCAQSSGVLKSSVGTGLLWALSEEVSRDFEVTRRSRTQNANGQDRREVVSLNTHLEVFPLWVRNLLPPKLLVVYTCALGAGEWDGLTSEFNRNPQWC